MNGAPPMAGPGMPLMGNTPLAPPGPDMAALDALAGMPFGADSDKAIQDAIQLLQRAMQGYQIRSPKAAKMLADAVSKAQAARQEVQSNQQGPMGAPPNLLGSSPQSPMGPMGMPPMGL